MIKKIGIYLSIGPGSGGSYQYCLSIIDAIKELKNDRLEFVFFIFNDKWRKILPSDSKIITIKKEFLTERFINILKIFNLPIIIHKFICSIVSKKIRLINKSNCSLVIFPSQEDEGANINDKSITTIHDLMHRYETSFSEYNIKEFKKREINYKRITRFSSKILVDSKIGKKHVLDNYRCKSNKVFILPFTSPKYLKYSKVINIYKKYNIPNKNFIFYPAQFWEHKNHLNLIKAFKIIKDKKKNLILILVGKEKNNLQNVKAEIKKHKLEKDIFILGYIDQEDIFTFYKKTSVVSFVSFAGPTNIPPIEAMSLGAPLICSKAYGMQEQVGNGGILIDPHSHIDIASKILEILNKNNLKKKLIKRGHEQYKKFDSNNFNKKLKKYLLL